ncbi:MAG: flagellar basal body P-ring formation protein FlgA [Hyphomicrobiales bacterium]|nr:flagellar basal body P-ring formation protein FlgA [Hyphomicrobiales bacterium]
MIRIATLILAAAVVTSATAQVADTTLLSPVPLTDADWATPRIAKKSARLTQETVSQTVSRSPTQTPPHETPAPVAQAAPGSRAAAPAAAPLLPLVPVASVEPTGPILKREAIIASDIVRIGDLVDNAGAVADVAIFRAPDLGQTGSVPAHRVAEAVRPHHIPLLDTRGLDAIRVTRSSRTVGAKELEAAIIRSIASQYGLTDAANLAVSFESEVRTVQIEPGSEPIVNRVSYDPRSRRFDGLLELPTGAMRRPLLRVSGALVETAEVVVPVRPLAQGEVLKSTDLRVERRPKTDAAGLEEVLGLAAKRALKPGQPIRAADVMRPELVGRNDNVTITFEVPGMLLTALGKALESGGEGDVINVVNVQSKRTIQATIRGPGRVSVSAATARLAAAGPESSPPRR